MQAVTHSDLQRFERQVRTAYRQGDSREVRLDNAARGYCLIYNFWPESCAETPEKEAQEVTSAIIDGMDFVYRR